MKQILCYGDSNTWGLIPGTTERYPWGIRWTSLLQEKLKDRDVRVLEEGLCGRTSVFEDSYRENRIGKSFYEDHEKEAAEYYLNIVASFIDAPDIQQKLRDMNSW